MKEPTSSRVLTYGCYIQRSSHSYKSTHCPLCLTILLSSRLARGSIRQRRDPLVGFNKSQFGYLALYYCSEEVCLRMGTGRRDRGGLNVKTWNIPGYMFPTYKPICVGFSFSAKSFSWSVTETMGVHKVSAESLHMGIGIFFPNFHVNKEL